MTLSEVVEQELHKLSYRQLQQRARDAGLKATGKAADILQRLVVHESGTDGTGGNKTPRAGTSGGEDKVRLLQAAVGTPLPAAENADEEEIGSREEPRRPRSKGGGMCWCLAQHSAHQPTVTRRGIPLFWVLLTTAMIAAGAALVMPYCQQHDCTELAHNLPELATEAGAAAYRQLRVQALTAAKAAQAQWQALPITLLGRDGAGSYAGPHACHFDATAALRAVMPKGGEMEMAQAAAADVLSSRGSEPQDKAAVALFVCQAEVDCHAAVEALGAAVVGEQRCMLYLQGQELGEDRGALQSKLAGYLLSVPNGMVMLQRIDKMSPLLLPVLINAMSEQGAFQQDGQAVPTAGTIFLLTSHMPTDVFEQLNEDVFKQVAKKHLVLGLALRAAEADRDAASVHAKALRRRIDFVLPVAANRAIPPSTRPL